MKTFFRRLARRSLIERHPPVLFDPKGFGRGSRSRRLDPLDPPQFAWRFVVVSEPAANRGLRRTDIDHADGFEQRKIDDFISDGDATVW
jgi:hypothetical protein